MNQEVQKRLAESLTADSTDIIPYLPYLLQDFAAKDECDIVSI